MRMRVYRQTCVSKSEIFDNDDKIEDYQKIEDDLEGNNEIKQKSSSHYKHPHHHHHHHRKNRRHIHKTNLHNSKSSME